MNFESFRDETPPDDDPHTTSLLSSRLQQSFRNTVFGCRVFAICILAVAVIVAIEWIRYIVWLAAPKGDYDTSAIVTPSIVLLGHFVLVVAVPTLYLLAQTWFIRILLQKQRADTLPDLYAAHRKSYIVVSLGAGLCAVGMLIANVIIWFS